MLESKTNSQALKPDEQVSFRLVEIDGVPNWQASNGRTFPVVAGAEDPPPGDDHNDQDSDKDKDEDGSGADADPQIARLRRDAARYRTELRQAQAQLDSLKADDQKRKDAEKTEVERLQARVTELEQQQTEKERELQETRNHQAIERAAVKAGAADPDDVYRLLNPDDFERDDSGKLTNADELVKALLKAKPYLAGKSNGTSGVPGTPRSNGNGGKSPDELLKLDREELRQSGRYNPL